jgi:hypothetical protein
MKMISMNEMKKRLRKTFRDDHHIQWSDALLDEILFEAQREYAFYSGGLTGKFEVFAGDSPVLSMPDDFYQVIGAIAPDGQAMPIVSYRKLVEDHGDFRTQKGNVPESLCFNFDSFGNFRIYPQLPRGTFAGTVFYKRIPKENEWEYCNPDAVESYAKFMMYQFTGKSLAQNSFNDFLEAVYKEKKQKLSAGNKIVRRTGVYY